MTVTVSSIQGWAAEVQSAIASLPEALDQAAPSGAFAEVLSRVADTIGAGPAGSPTGTTAAVTTSPATLETLGAATGATSGPRAQEVLGLARALVGTPYVWGGGSPQQGFDCSGLVQYVYAGAGIELPRTSEEQALAGSAVPSLAQAQPGDLVFFAGSDGTPASPGHVGIYIGDGQMIDAPHSGTDVQVQAVAAAGVPVAVRRVLPTVQIASSGFRTPSSSAAWGANPVPAAGSASIGSGVPQQLAPLFLSAAGRYGVPVTLLTAVARHESDFEPGAVSSAGAEGIMQIMPGTAAGLGVTPFTPGQAIDGAARLLSGYIGQFGSVPLALAAYDAGPGAVQEHGGVPPYPETQAYVTSIMHTIGSSASAGVR